MSKLEACCVIGNAGAMAFRKSKSARVGPDIWMILMGQTPLCADVYDDDDDGDDGGRVDAAFGHARGCVSDAHSSARKRARARVRVWNQRRSAREFHWKFGLASGEQTVA